jgi:hypothetical protein
MVVGGMWLIYQQKIYIDRTTGAQITTEIEVPLLGKFKTNTPALVLFILGVILLIYAPVKLADLSRLQTELDDLRGRVPKEVTIRGKVNTIPASRVDIYAVTALDTVPKPGSFSLRVPVLKQMRTDYKLVYITENGTIDADVVSLLEERDGILPVPDKEISPSSRPVVEAGEISPPNADFK